MNSRSLAVCLLALLCLSIKAVTIPKEHVFLFERSTNGNYICYDINLKDGKLCEKEPLTAYWVLGGGTRTEGLTFLDRKMAFGVKVVSAKKDEATVYLTAHKDLKIRICRHKGKWVGIVRLDGHEMILRAEKLSKRYFRRTGQANHFYAVREVCLELHPGEDPMYRLLSDML